MDFTVGRWRARLVPLARASAALALRGRMFRAGRDDRDPFDAGATHLMVDGPDGLAACARLQVQAGAAMLGGYTADRYDLGAFAGIFPRALEVGRICLDPDRARDPDVPRLILAVLARLVEAEAVAVLYGCSSFPADGAGMLRLRGHVAPAGWRPGVKAPSTVPLPDVPGPLPPLLRAWLSMGAGVSDHAVVDRDLDTLHVFTALPVAAIPPARARLLTGMLSPV